MYATAAPVTPAPGGRMAGLGLVEVAHRQFGPGGGRIDDPFSERHFTDLTSGYGMTYRADVAARSRGNTFAAMSAALVDGLAPAPDPFGVAVVAHATPDLDCRYAAATYLSDLPGVLLSFAVSENGGCTPFTALRLAGAYTARHSLRRAVVLVLDQSTLPYDLAPGVAPAGDAGVALVLGEGGDSMSFGHVAGARRTNLSGAVAEAIGQAIGQALPGGVGGTPVEVLAGPGVETGQVPAEFGRVTRIDNGFPCSGLWSALATRFGQPARPGSLTVLVDADPARGDVSACVIFRGFR
ncbi:hypothetical protein [Protofrankia coriariae]|uniref:hypothetical protein n=1 Tax=Protofrankia coriariae TaxID=1562887 RepID=UPI000699275B|nr:hypothetical protein [Protofrankia coriariae]ONH37574.1 hypothetical protein BL254_03220 [Protofrankia sp. BMG5.30]